MKFYTTHFLKFSIIKIIYFLLKTFNFKKFFFNSDFDLKKNSFHKENVIEKKLLLNMFIVIKNHQKQKILINTIYGMEINKRMNYLDYVYNLIYNLICK